MSRCIRFMCDKIVRREKYRFNYAKLLSGKFNVSRFNKPKANDIVS
jgi:hypothetical protein